MRKLLAVTAVLLTAALPSAFAQNSAKGTWRYDPAQSDFGSQPKPKSIRLVVTKDTPAMLAWHLTEVDADGKTQTRSWSGPEDGSMHPLRAAGKKNESSFKREGDDIIRQAKMADGAMEESHISMSDDGNTMTEHVTGTDKDGKQFTATLVWHRLKAAKKPAS
jgi:hypothetical protein